MLQKLNFKPGFNKQDTESGAEGQWTDGDFVRFRYGLPDNMLLLLSLEKNIQLLVHHKVCFYTTVMIFLILHH